MFSCPYFRRRENYQQVYSFSYGQPYIYMQIINKGSSSIRAGVRHGLAFHTGLLTYSTNAIMSGSIAILTHLLVIICRKKIPFVMALCQNGGKLDMTTLASVWHSSGKTTPTLLALFWDRLSRGAKMKSKRCEKGSICVGFGTWRSDSEAKDM